MVTNRGKLTQIYTFLILFFPEILILFSGIFYTFFCKIQSGSTDTSATYVVGLPWVYATYRCNATYRRDTTYRCNS